MVKSWIRQATILLFTVLFVLSVFIAWTNFNYNSQLQKTAARENAAAVSTWSGTVETQLNTLYEHMYDLLLTIYNNTELGVGTPAMQIEVRRQCLDSMADKLLYNELADCFFVRDNEDLFLFSFKPGIRNREAGALKKFALEQTEDTSRGIGYKQWHLATVDGQDYFVKTISLGKYIVGATSKLSHYDIQKYFNILGEECSCILQTQDNEGLYHCSGEDWREELLFKNGKPYYPDGRLVVDIPFPAANATAILAIRNSTLLQSSGRAAAIVLLICSAICLGSIVYLLVFLYRQVIKPSRVLLKANQEISSGNFEYRIEAQASNLEFAELFDSYNYMAAQIVRLNRETYEHLQRHQENQLRILRAQIKPHFYLNAITTITNMTYQDKPEVIRTYISGLAKYLRYMMNTYSRWTTVADEMGHIHNYLQMQELRFPGSIVEDLQYDEAVAHTPIPMLALFTLVENSIKHAMTLYEPMKLVIRCSRYETESFTGIRIIEEDSGDGFPQDVIDMMCGEKLPEMTKDHLGLSNLCYTLNLIYRRNDLLHISNRADGGAHVEMWIPEGEIQDEAIDL